MEQVLPAPPPAAHLDPCGASPAPKMPQGNAHGAGTALFRPPANAGSPPGSPHPSVGCQRFSKLGEIPTLPLCSLRERAEEGGGGEAAHS